MIQSPDNRMLRRTTTTISGTMAAHRTQDDLCKKREQILCLLHIRRKSEAGGIRSLGCIVGGDVSIHKQHNLKASVTEKKPLIQERID